MQKSKKIFLLFEFIAAAAMIAGIVPTEFSYVFLAVLVAGILTLSDLEALQLYVLSIPVFVVFPASFLSDAMSVWRVALLVLAGKVIEKRFHPLSVLTEKDLDFADKKKKLADSVRVFVGEARSSNYYSLVLPVVLFGAASLLSLLFAQSLGAGIKKMIFLGNIFLLFGIAWFSIKSKDDAMKVLKSVFASAIFILLVGYLQLVLTFLMTLSDFWGAWDDYVINAFYGEKTMVLLSYSNTWFSYYGSDEIPATLRMFSVMQDSHSFAILMILFMPLALFYRFSSSSRKEKWKYSAIFLLMMIAILFSGSRGSWVGWLAALVSALYFCMPEKFRHKLNIVKPEEFAKNRGIYKKVMLSVLCLAALFPVSAFVLGKSQDAQLVMEGKALGRDNFALFRRTWSISDMDEVSNKGRREIWYNSAVSVMNHPITGIGLGNFPLALSEKITTAKMGASAHNIYLDVAVETGLLGLMIFLYLLWRICEKLFRLSNKFREEKLRLLSFSFLVYFLWIFAYGFFDVVILNDKVLTFTVIILAVMYRLEDMEEKEITEDSTTGKRQGAAAASQVGTF